MSRRALQTISVWGTFDENLNYRRGSGVIFFEPAITTTAAIIVVTSIFLDEKNWRYTSMGTFLGLQLSLFVYDSPLHYGIFTLIIAFTGIATDSALIVCILTASVWAACIFFYINSLSKHKF